MLLRSSFKEEAHRDEHRKVLRGRGRTVGMTGKKQERREATEVAPRRPRPGRRKSKPVKSGQEHTTLCKSPVSECRGKLP